EIIEEGSLLYFASVQVIERFIHEIKSERIFSIVFLERGLSGVDGLPCVAYRCAYLHQVRAIWGVYKDCRTDFLLHGSEMKIFHHADNGSLNVPYAKSLADGVFNTGLFYRGFI